jgi:DNA-binding transcriptional MerR regulator
MLGISPNTLRTWDRRYGLGPSVREDGRHRRYSDNDVRRLRRMIALTGSGMSTAAAAALAIADPAEPDTPTVGWSAQGSSEQSVRGFLDAARRLDAPLMQELAHQLLAEHGVAAAWDLVFTPLLVELGHGPGVEVEHLASASVQHALRQAPIPQERGRLPALLACAPDEQHTLPLDALAALLSERGCAYRNLGARVPAAALLKTVRRLRPFATIVWAHVPELAQLVPLEDLLTSGHTTVVVAGPGWLPDSLPEGVRRVNALREAADVVTEISSA